MEHVVPEVWKQADMSTIYKKDNRKIAANFCPVSLIRLCCKLQEHTFTSASELDVIEKLRH